MASEVDICNLALQRLGAKSITSLTENSKNARECNRIYAHARDSELRAHPWAFARKRVQLAASSTAPTFGFDNAFPLPADYLRILPTAAQEDFQIEDRSILTDDGSPLDVIYIKRVTDPNEFDQLFSDLLVSRIALDMAEIITQSKNKIEIANTRYTLLKREARKINAFEGPAQEPGESTWVTARL